MDRLNKTNINTPDLTYKFFKERWRGMLHWCDWPRFKFLAKNYKGGKYLDMGCFNSPMPFELTRDGHKEIYAVDYSEPLIKELKEKFPEVNYQVEDIKKLSFKDNDFDYIVAGEFIEHMESPKDALAEMVRVLKPGGTLAVSTPLNELERGMVSDEHLWSFSSSDLLEMLSPYGEVEVNYYQDTVPLLVVFLKKK